MELHGLEPSVVFKDRINLWQAARALWLPAQPLSTKSSFMQHTAKPDRLERCMHLCAKLGCVGGKPLEAYPMLPCNYHRDRLAHVLAL